MTYVIYFSFLLLFSLCFSGTKISIDKFFFKTGMLVVVLLPVVFRYNIGTDYQNYVSIYNAIKNNLWYNTDKGWEFLCRFFQVLHLNAETLISTVAFFTVYLFYKSFDKKRIVLQFILFYIFLYFPSYNIIRQIFSLSIIFYIITHIDKNKFLLFILFVCAVLIHYASIIFSFVLFFNTKTLLNKKRTIILFILILFIVPKINLVGVIKHILMTFDSKYSFYLDGIYSNNIKSSGFMLLLQQYFTLTLLFFIDEKKIDNRRRTIIYRLSLLSIVMYSVAMQFIIFARFKYSFFILYIFLIPYIKNRKLYYYIIYLFIFIFAIVSFISLFNGENGIYPYRSIF